MQRGIHNALAFSGQGVVPLSESQGIYLVTPHDTVRHEVVPLQKTTTSNEVCSICLEEAQDDDNKVYRTACHHTFHRSCLREWVQGQRKIECPVCRAPHAGVIVRDPSHDPRIVERRISYRSSSFAQFELTLFVASLVYIGGTYRMTIRCFPETFVHELWPRIQRAFEADLFFVPHKSGNLVWNIPTENAVALGIRLSTWGY